MRRGSLGGLWGRFPPTLYRCSGIVRRGAALLWAHGESGMGGKVGAPCVAARSRARVSLGQAQGRRDVGLWHGRGCDNRRLMHYARRGGIGGAASGRSGSQRGGPGAGCRMCTPCEDATATGVLLAGLCPTDIPVLRRVGGAGSRPVAEGAGPRLAARRRRPPGPGFAPGLPSRFLTWLGFGALKCFWSFGMPSPPR